MLFILDNKSTSWFVPMRATLHQKQANTRKRRKTGVSLETLFDSNTRQITPEQKTTHIETKKCSHMQPLREEQLHSKKHNLPLRSYENKANSNQRHSQKKLKETISTSVTFEEEYTEFWSWHPRAHKTFIGFSNNPYSPREKGRLIYRAKSLTHPRGGTKKSTS